MDEYSIFYYPYSYFMDYNLPFLKAIALYFDKLYILEPLKASFATIRVTLEINYAIVHLEEENILERIELRHGAFGYILLRYIHAEVFQPDIRDVNIYYCSSNRISN